MKTTIDRPMRKEVSKGMPLVRAEVVKRGLRGNTLSEMAARGVIYRVARGVYVPASGSQSEYLDYETAAKVIKDYQSKGLLTFLVGKVIDQAIEAGVKMGLELRVIPLGYDVTSVIHVVSVAVRAALIFGGLTPGDLAGLLEYTSKRVPAFVNAFGPLSELVVSAGAGAIALGFPVITDQTVLEVPMNL